MPDEKKRELYAAYSEAGYKIKVYDYPMMQTAGKRRYLRDFDIEELLFRKPIAVNNEKTAAYEAEYDIESSADAFVKAVFGD